MNDQELRMLSDGLLKVQQAASLSGLGKSKLYELMDDGALPYVKIGRARRIPKNALLEFIAEHLQGR